MYILSLNVFLFFQLSTAEEEGRAREKFFCKLNNNILNNKYV